MFSPAGGILFVGWRTFGVL